MWDKLKSNPLFVTFTGGLAGALIDALSDAVQKNQLDLSLVGLKHLITAAVIGGVVALVHLYRPAPSEQKAIGGGNAALVFAFAALLILFPTHVVAQSPANLYAVGVSANPNASPAIAGTALYARLLSADAGTYAFTAFDAVPTTSKPFTVTTNIGVGVSQKLLTMGKVNLYSPTAVGASWSGPNAGYQWNTGVLAAIPFKGKYWIMPTARFLKSNVSGGSGYQPMFTVLFGWSN